ncbi:MAG: YdjY domain-containing protein [bacterium]
MKLIILLSQLFISTMFSQISDTLSVHLQEISENTYRLATILINTEKREIQIPGKVNINTGLIEVFACAPFGKLHESVLVLDVVPYYLQVSLLLLGLNSTELNEYLENKEKADLVEIYVEWEKDGKQVRFSAEDLIFNIKDSCSMKHTKWVFIGSKIINGRFMADENRSLITTYNDPFTIIDNPLKDGNNDEVYFANSKIIPPKNTSVNLIIKATN